MILLRYGLVGREPNTLEEIGRVLGFTRERVRQIELQALQRLGRLREMEGVAAFSAQPAARRRAAARRSTEAERRAVEQVRGAVP